ncbi:MAG: hypothetical protein ACYDEX_12680 [Mobilitalea sp.]
MRKLIVFLILTTALLVMVTGCGKSESSDTDNDTDRQAEETVNSSDSDTEGDSDSEDTNDEDSEDTSDETSASAQDFLSITKAADILNTFKEFGFVYNSKASDAENVAWTFDYVSLGTESIEGVEADHIKITIVENGETKDYEGWYDETWTAVKYITSEGEVTGVDAGWSGSNLTMMTQLYCNLLLVNAAVFDEDGAVDEYMYEVQDPTNESIDLGNGNTDIDVILLSSKMGDYDKVLGSTIINEKKMYTVLETVSKDKASLDGLRITRAIPR